MEDIKEFLIDAKKALIDLEEKKKEINVLKGKEATFTQNLNELNKTKEDLIKKTIKERKENIEKEYSERITNINTKIDEAKEKREKEKKKNIAALTEKETRVKKENNLFLNNEIKRVLKENKLPNFVNSKFYLSLFKCKTVGEAVRAFFWFLICFILIPVLLIFINREASIWIKGAIVVIDILIFGGLWLIIENFVKVDDDILNQIRELRKDIRDNEKEINKITKDISKSNKGEELFDYAEFDKEIQKEKEELIKAKEKQEEAIKEFSEKEINEITERIEGAADRDISKVKAAIDKTKAELEKAQKTLENINSKINEKYATYIGHENMNTAKLDKLIDIVNENADITIEEALNKILGKK